ncbi:MAG: response regulator [Deltaproteobacteria bacterium]|nr:response regulator [Deltaproteobacteria bacterium]
MEKILIVDDDRLIRTVACEILTKAGYDVKMAKCPEEGLELLKKEKAEIILLDVVMPGESGFEMIPQIRALNRDAAIIIMTAYASTDSAVEAIRKDVYDYIKKPFNEDELLHSVMKTVERQHLLTENRSLVKKLTERIRRLELFEKLSKAISSTLDLDKLLEKIMDISKSVLNAEACSILLLDKVSGELVFTVALGEKGDEVKEFRIKRGQGVAGWVLEHGESLLIEDLKKDKRFFSGVDKKTGFESRTMIAVPLFVKDQIVGVIEVINKNGKGYFNESDKETLITMAGQIAVAIDNAKMTEALKISREKIEGYSKNLEAMVKKRTAQLEKANEEIKNTHAQLLQTEKLSSLGQLAAGVAHEINNPIGFIQSNLKTLKEYVHDLMAILYKSEDVVSALKKKDQKAFFAQLKELEKIKKEVGLDFIKDDIEKLVSESEEGTYRVYKIVRDLRDFSRADDADRKIFDLHRAIDSTLNIVWNELKYKAEVIKEYGNIPEVECFPTQLNQVFMNLFVNASQAIKNKGEIRIKTFSENEKVFVEVSDTGAGIPPDIINKLFDPFFTTKEPGKGTGLGLAISYNIIKKHNGNITVMSNPGEGTTFLIELPVRMKVAKECMEAF